MDVVILGYRVAGLDGVSLETIHWKNVFERMGHKVTLVAGELDREGVVIPELHFKWPQVAGVHDRVVYGDEPYEKVEKAIFTIAGDLEGRLRKFFRNGYHSDLLIVPNVFSLPIHFPLAVALTRVIQEFNIKTIARHHDFWWERQRYLKSTMFHFFKHWFPPKIPQITHTVINSIAQKELYKRTKINADIIWDCFDFDSGLNEVDSYNKFWRRDMGIAQDDVVFLQATRIVPRKRIEISIKFLEKLGLDDAVLVVSGHEGDEKTGYLKNLKKLAKEANIKCVFNGDRVNSHRKIVGGKRVYTLWDCYVNSDFVTYPTGKEGFGNQFVESTYFKKPIILTPYKVYKKDIKPLGFKTIEISTNPNKKSINMVRKLLRDDKKRKTLVNYNYKLGKKEFSYDWVEGKIRKLLKEMKLN